LGSRRTPEPLAGLGKPQAVDACVARFRFHATEEHLGAAPHDRKDLVAKFVECSTAYASEALGWILVSFVRYSHAALSLALTTKVTPLKAQLGSSHYAFPSRPKRCQ